MNRHFAKAFKKSKPIALLGSTAGRNNAYGDSLNSDN